MCASLTADTVVSDKRRLRDDDEGIVAVATPTPWRKVCTRHNAGAHEVPTWTQMKCRNVFCESLRAEC